MKQAIEVTLNKAQMADIKKAIKQNSVSVSHDIKELRKQIDRLNYRLNDIHNLMLKETLKETNVDETVVVKYDGIEHNSEYDNASVSSSSCVFTGNDSLAEWNGHKHQPIPGKVQEYEKEVKELKDRISEAVGTSTSTV